MSSYTKQMIAVALEWLAANPRTASTFLKVPGLDKNTGRHAATAQDPIDYEAQAKRVPAALPLVQELRRVQADQQDTLENLHAKEAELERLVNLSARGQTKDTVDNRHHADRGRWALAWARHGYNVFELSTDFTAAILLTDAKDLDIASVRLPFNGLLMLVPDGFARGAEGGSYTKIHITEIPQQDLRMFEAASTVVQALTKIDLDQRLPLLDKLFAEKATDKLPGFVSGDLTKVAADLDATAIHIYASDGVHVLTTLIDRKDLSWDSFDDLPDAVTHDADKQARQTLRQIVFGALAYASAVDRAVEPRDEPTRRAPASDTPRAKRWSVGRTIKIDPRIVSAVRDGSREVEFRLKTRFIVRGHYRNQAHGPKRSLRTSKWIAPFWKGPEEGAKLVHTYTLDESKEI